MFTGIVEAVGTVAAVTTEGTNRRFIIEAPFAGALAKGQSVAHDGVCLSVEEVIDAERYGVTAVEETLAVTTLSEWKAGTPVNLERAVRPQSFLDGHIVQGHVDTVAECVEKRSLDGSHRFTFRLPPMAQYPVIYKGSIAINGVSLTVARWEAPLLDVAIIPITLRDTTFRHLQPGDRVNVEFDVVGKYVFEWMRQTAL